MFLFQKVLKRGYEMRDGVCSTQNTSGSDTAEGTKKNTVIVQMEEEERDIRSMSFVTTCVRAVRRVTGYPDVLCFQRV